MVLEELLQLPGLGRTPTEDYTPVLAQCRGLGG